MKYNNFLLLVMIFSLFGMPTKAFSQVTGIGTTTPDASSALDIVNDKAGILIPRVVLIAKDVATPVVSPANSLLVYNTNDTTIDAVETGTTVTPGYYYWSNDQWNRVSTSSELSKKWSLKGNEIDDEAFLGTTNNKDLVFKVNKIFAGKLSSTNTAFGVGSLYSVTTGVNNVSLGVASLTAVTTGSENVSLGVSSLQSASSAGFNVAIGTASASALRIGSQNVAIGQRAMLNATTANENTIVGSDALRGHISPKQTVAIGRNAAYLLKTGDNNTFLGTDALSSVSSANSVTAIGHTAGAVSTTLKNVDQSFNTYLGVLSTHNSTTPISYATAIGAKAQVSASNTIILGRTTGVDRDKVGIGTSLPTHQLNVKADADPIKLEGLQAVGSLLASDNMMIANASGVLKMITPAILNSTPSDLRLKKDIETSSYGLNFISKLRPVLYKMKTGTTDLHSGFIAQEVEHAAKEVHYEFSGIVKPQTATDFYSLKYAEFVVPLVKAVQEQQSQIESYEAKIKNLENNQQAQQKEMAELKDMVSKMAGK